MDQILKKNLKLSTHTEEKQHSGAHPLAINLSNSTYQL